MKKYSLSFYFGLVLFLVTHDSLAESVVRVQVPTEIGFKQQPLVEVEIEIDKTRDLHIVLQSKIDGSWSTEQSKFKRLKKSGAYKFKMPLGKVLPGNYRWSIYLTPRGGNWNQRLDKPTFSSMTILDTPTAKEKVFFSKQDKVQQAKWPNLISDDASYTLEVQYAITEPRNLNIILYNSDNWSELGVIKLPVKEPGKLSVPFDSLLSNFGEGKYVWTIYFTDNDGNELQKKKLGRHFTIEKAQQ